MTVLQANQQYCSAEPLLLTAPDGAKVLSTENNIKQTVLQPNLYDYTTAKQDDITVGQSSFVAQPKFDSIHSSAGDGNNGNKALLPQQKSSTLTLIQGAVAVVAGERNYEEGSAESNHNQANGSKNDDLQNVSSFPHLVGPAGQEGQPIITQFQTEETNVVQIMDQ